MFGPQAISSNSEDRCDQARDGMVWQSIGANVDKIWLFDHSTFPLSGCLCTAAKNRAPTTDNGIISRWLLDIFQ